MKKFVLALLASIVALGLLAPTASASRNRHATVAMKPARTRPQSRIDPSSADHMVAMLNRSGVLDDPWSKTNSTL